VFKYFRDGKFQRPWKPGDLSTVSFDSQGRLCDLFQLAAILKNKLKKTKESASLTLIPEL
jgi:hypothetical protein